MLTFLPKVSGSGSQKSNLTPDPFFTLSLDMLCVIGSDGYFQQLNPNWEKTLGFKTPELLAQPWLEIVYSQDRELTLNQLRKLTTNSEPISFKNRCLCADGSYKWCLWNVSYSREQQLIYAVVRDQTECKQSKEALWDSEEHFHCLVENVKDYAIYMLDPTGRIITWNQGAERINGYQEAEILGQPVSCLYPPEDVESGKPQQVLKIAAEVGRFEDENFRVRRDGSRFWANAVITALRDQQGRLRGFAKVVRDITERKLAEEALQKAHYQLEKRVAERTAELVKTNKRLTREISERKQVEKELRWSETQLRQQTQQLQQALHHLKQAQTQLVHSEKMSSLGQLVAGVAHEINNPVSFIYGNLNYAEQYFQDLLKVIKVYQQCCPHPAPQVQEQIQQTDFDFLITDLPKLLNSMKVGADRIYQIVRSLRNFSHLDRAEKKPVNIHEGIDNTLLILQSRLKATSGHSEIEIIKEYGDLPLIDCYAGELNQVFMNILSNGIDAIEESLITGNLSVAKCQGQIRIRTEMIDGNRVAIHISDNGLGIPEIVKQRLFDPFFTTKPVGKGTGLGLSISYQIVVEKHGGHLKCFSTPGQGTEFVIEIPIGHSSQQCCCPSPYPSQLESQIPSSPSPLANPLNQLEFMECG